MDDGHGWVCDCGYSVPVVEGDSMATLRRWAEHVRDAHGEEVLQEAVSEIVDESAEELKAEGKVISDPFTGDDYWWGDPPGGYTK
jgi:hypothetical protein